MADDYFMLVCDDVPNDVVLTDPGICLLDVAQVVRRLTGLSLWRSKDLATQLPAVILGGVPQGDAESAVAALREVGAQAQVREQPALDHLQPSGTPRPSV
ncbi:ribosomal protein L7/L12 [Streptomyces atroolivaceus]|uniref:ribosomal protein L7/L12 n=1 Tax=Streptomyces atroolivaceus TaxID=66869 RepID=UPI0036AE7FBF